jgi:hypothetical protein
MMLAITAESSHLGARSDINLLGQRRLVYFYSPARFEVWIAARSDSRDRSWQRSPNIAEQALSYRRFLASLSRTDSFADLAAAVEHVALPDR